MERLTENVLGNIQLKVCGNDFCKETCAEHDEEKSCDNCPIQKAFEKLAEYEDLEEQGKLLKLPCVVGDTVYRIEYKYTKCSKFGEEFEESSCCGCESECDSHKEYYIVETNPQLVNWVLEHMKYFGKTVFLTKSAAEQALKEMEGKK